MTLEQQINELRANLCYLRVFANDKEKYHITMCIKILDRFADELEIDKNDYGS